MLERGVVECVCMYVCMQTWNTELVCAGSGKGRHSGACECDDRSGSMMSGSMCVWVCMRICVCVVAQCER